MQLWQSTEYGWEYQRFRQLSLLSLANLPGLFGCKELSFSADGQSMVVGLTGNRVHLVHMQPHSDDNSRRVWGPQRSAQFPFSGRDSLFAGEAPFAGHHTPFAHASARPLHGESTRIGRQTLGGLRMEGGWTVECWQVEGTSWSTQVECLLWLPPTHAPPRTPHAHAGVLFCMRNASSIYYIHLGDKSDPDALGWSDAPESILGGGYRAARMREGVEGHGGGSYATILADLDLLYHAFHHTDFPFLYPRVASSIFLHSTPPIVFSSFT